MDLMSDLMSPNVLDDYYFGSNVEENGTLKYHHINIKILPKVVLTYHIITKKYELQSVNTDYLENMEINLYDGPGFLTTAKKLGSYVNNHTSNSKEIKWNSQNSRNNNSSSGNKNSLDIMTFDFSSFQGILQCKLSIGEYSNDQIYFSFNGKKQKFESVRVSSNVSVKSLHFNSSKNRSGSISIILITSPQNSYINRSFTEILYSGSENMECLYGGISFFNINSTDKSHITTKCSSTFRRLLHMRNIYSNSQSWWMYSDYPILSFKMNSHQCMVIQFYNDPHPILNYTVYKAMQKYNTYVYIDKGSMENSKMYKYVLHGYYDTYDIKKFQYPTLKKYAASVKIAGEGYRHDPEKDLLISLRHNNTVSFVRGNQLSYL